MFPARIFRVALRAQQVPRQIPHARALQAVQALVRVQIARAACGGQCGVLWITACRIALRSAFR
jgi:hypothetical protein